jgi:NADH-quinone oxidoreductase subunit J
MSCTWIILAVLTIAGAVAALSLRNLVHCALALALALAGLAAIYLQLDAQFVGFAQFLVYIGAVAILIVFAILLTRGAEPPAQAIFSRTWGVGLAVAAAVFGVLCAAIAHSRVLAPNGGPPPAPAASVRQIGDQLMTKYILPLEVTGLLLTAALIGAVIIALREPEKKS